MRACEGAHGGARMGLEQEADGLSHLHSLIWHQILQAATGNGQLGGWLHVSAACVGAGGARDAHSAWCVPRHCCQKLSGLARRTEGRSSGAGPGRRRQKETCVPKWDEVVSRGECEGRLFCPVPVDSRSRPQELHDKTECPITSAPGAQDGSPYGCPCLSVPVCCQTASPWSHRSLAQCTRANGFSLLWMIPHGLSNELSRGTASQMSMTLGLKETTWKNMV